MSRIKANECSMHVIRCLLTLRNAHSLHQTICCLVSRIDDMKV
jgi:hypothetical protein